jgi:hypothetical protein
MNALIFALLVSMITPARPIEDRPVPVSATVSEVLESGILVTDLRWLDEQKDEVIAEGGQHYIALRNVGSYDLYEGLAVNLHARPDGTVPVGGRRLKQWQHVPKESAPKDFQGKYPADLE